MRYRIYFKAPDGTESVKEVEAPGEITQVCDDHGRLVFGIDREKGGIIAPIPILTTKEPSIYA